MPPTCLNPDDIPYCIVIVLQRIALYHTVPQMLETSCELEPHFNMRRYPAVHVLAVWRLNA